MFQFDADLNTIDEGVWAEYGGSRFKIAHTSNLKFQRALARLQQPHRRKIELNTLDPKTNREIFCQAMAEAVLLDWEHVLGADQAEIPYSVKDGTVALMKNPDFRDFVSDFAINMANYRKEEVEALGNS